MLRIPWTATKINKAGQTRSSVIRKRRRRLAFIGHNIIMRKEGLEYLISLVKLVGRRGREITNNAGQPCLMDEHTNDNIFNFGNHGSKRFVRHVRQRRELGHLIIKMS